MTASDVFTAFLWQSKSASEVNKKGTRSTKTDIVLAFSCAGGSDKAFLFPLPRCTAVLFNLSREVKTFSCLLTSLPYQQVSRDTARGGGVSHSEGRKTKSRVCHPVCLFLLGRLPNYMFLVSASVWSGRFLAQNDSFLESTLLCHCTVRVDALSSPDSIIFRALLWHESCLARRD